MKEHTTTARVRYGETDQMGVVYHANYLLFFEMGRTEWMRAEGLPYAALEERGFFLTVTEAHLNFKSPGRYDAELKITTKVGEVGKASVRFDYEVRDGAGTVLCDGFTRLACVDRKQKILRIPKDVLDRLMR